MLSVQKAKEITVGSRTYNSVRNIIWAFINKIAVIIMPFVVRTVMLYKLGAEYTGLNSLFTSLLAMLSLAELGFSNAMVYCMYEPIHKNDTSTVCAIMRLYKRIYQVIGIVILLAGLLILPFLPRFINGTVPDGINIYILYLIYLVNTSVSYFLFAYKSSLLAAFQRNDIISVIGLCCNVGMYLVQIGIVLLTNNFYLYAIMLPVCTVITNIIYEKTSRQLFPEIICQGEVSPELKSKIKKRVIGVMLYKFSSTTRTSFDSIIISSFLGLILLSQYQNYFMVISSIIGILSVISNAITASVGDSIVSKSVEDNYKDFRKFVFIYMWLAGFCTASILTLIQPFMRMWVGEKLMLSFSMAVLFSIYFYAQSMGDIVFLYRTAAGLWWQDRILPVVEAIVNIALNLCLVKLWGIYGVIFATIITLLVINFLWGAKILFKHYFKRSMREYLRIQIVQMIITCIASMITVYISFSLPNTIQFFLLKMLICVIVPNAIYYVSYRETSLFGEVKVFMYSVLRVIRKRQI